MNRWLHISKRFALLTTVLHSAYLVGFAEVSHEKEPEQTQKDIVNQTENKVILDGATTSGDESRPRKKNFINAFLEYLDDSNKEKSNKKVDFSFLGGPFYSSEAKFGVGLVAAAIYRTSPLDSLCIPSNVSIYGGYIHLASLLGRTFRSPHLVLRRHKAQLRP